MTATAVREYVALRTETVPTAIHTEAENETAIRKIEELADNRRLSVAERTLMQLLTVLVEAFEEEHYPLPRKVPPIEVLKELIEANGLKQKDLTDVFGTPSIVSEVIHGRRNLTTAHLHLSVDSVSLLFLRAMGCSISATQQLTKPGPNSVDNPLKFQN